MSDRIHLCLSDLLDQDPSSQEYFNGLAPAIRQQLLIQGEIRSFDELQHEVERLRQRLQGPEL